MTGRWPYPGDSPVQVARRCALAYRRHVPDPARAALDARLARQWGQAWLLPTPVIRGDDDHVPPSEVAAILNVSVAAVAQLRRRGRLPAVHTKNGWRYRVGDIWELLRSRPRNGARIIPASDTMRARGTRVPGDRT